MSKLKNIEVRENDKVKVIQDRPRYKREGIQKGMVGYLEFGFPLKNQWSVVFSGEAFQIEGDDCWHFANIQCCIREEDLEVTNDPATMLDVFGKILDRTPRLELDKRGNMKKPYKKSDLSHIWEFDE